MPISTLPRNRQPPSGTQRLLVWISVMAVAALAWLLLDRLEEEARRAETQATALMIQQLQAQTLLREVEARMGRRPVEANAGGNPMSWLRVAPAQYRGVCRGAAELPAGHWCFLERRPGLGRLLYRPRFPAERERGEAVRAWKVVRERGTNGAQGRLQLITAESLTPGPEDRVD